MGDAIKLKILVLGPLKTGKTTLCNFLSGQGKVHSGKGPETYHPTVGVRIIEFDRELERPRRLSIQVELWDCSGDKKYEYGWPAVMKDAQGILFVFNPYDANVGARGQQERELENWHSRFAPSIGLRDTQMSVFAHNSTGEQQQKWRGKLGKNMLRIPVECTSVEYDAEVIRAEFDRLLTRIANTVLQKREDEEQSIIANGNENNFL
eukprot:TRINITY_DN3872_c0_g1_i1.p1 TRINITY_DN3872_c0_g1~~TRINITY_DN3872_c0_g1_i1.p1  ORF type:complete len:207 (-),score=53.71 TRINITY_DN3872_c0_g1_i1:79-699(-)